jgi:hypothetical protein
MLEPDVVYFDKNIDIVQPLMSHFIWLGGGHTDQPICLHLQVPRLCHQGKFKKTGIEDY